jgi:hypothetical protein
MITCPWCGTNYLSFQTNCAKCGGPLQPSGTETTLPAAGQNLPIPPAPPRTISERFVWRLLWTDGWWIAAFVFGLLGIIFGLVGAGLTAGIITALVGIPFLFVGLVLSVAGGMIFIWRYQTAQKVVSVLRDGISTPGVIVELQQNYSVRINGRSPWVISYQYLIGGQRYTAQVSTLNQPGAQLQAGSAVGILYLPAEPRCSSIYPHP